MCLENRFIILFSLLIHPNSNRYRGMFLMSASQIFAGFPDAERRHFAMVLPDEVFHPFGIGF